MRTTAFGMVAALLLLPAGAAAQTTTDQSSAAAPQPDASTAGAASPDAPWVNQVDVGYRGTHYAPGSDEARYQRYRDLRDGPTADVLRVFKDTDQYRYTIQADHVGYRDQRYSASYDRFGKVKLAFEWNQIPLYYSGTTQTLYDQSNPGLLLMADSIQSGIQNKTLTLNTALLGATPFDLRTQRNIAGFSISA
jgi:opacity protein-like surface antigen